jgi:uncharacterized protein involved in response to NO
MVPSRGLRSRIPRASLGHTGRALVATTATKAIYGLALIGIAARIAAAATDWSSLLLPFSGLAWSAAFLVFVAGYGPLLCTDSRRNG